MEVSSDTITLGWKKELNISISDDFKKVDIYNENSDLSGRFIMIGNDYYDVKSHNIPDNYLILEDEIKNEYLTQTTAKLFFDKTDLINSEHFYVSPTGIVAEKNLVVTGGLFLENCTVCFTNNCKILVNGGVLKANRAIYNDFLIPLSTHMVKIITTGSYGRDNYRSSSDTSVVNGDGTLDLNSVWWYQDVSSRSDWDLRENTNIVLLNTNLVGSSDAYHHILSKNCKIDNFTVINSYSIELMVTPVFIRSFKSINCHYGLSFYPPGSTPFVKLYNVDIKNPTVTIKRNNRSNIELIDPIIDLNKLSVTGTTPIKILHSTNDKVVDHLGSPLSNMLVTYLYEKLNIVSVNNNELTMSATVEFIHLMDGDDIYISDNDKNDYKGEYKTVKSVNGKLIVLETPLYQQYDESTMFVQKKMGSLSDEKGNVPPLEIPYAFMETGSDTINYYNAVTKLYSVDGKNHKQIVFAYKGSNDIIQSSLVQQEENDTSEQLTRIENTMSEILNSINKAPDDEFYTNFVSAHS